MRKLNPMIIVLAAVLLASAASGQKPAAAEREIIGYFDNVTKYGSYAGGYDGDKLDKNNAGMKAALMKYGKRADILSYKFPTLKDRIFLTTSKDGRLRIYSWDMNTGGTMHNYDNVFQYRGKSGKVYSWTRKGLADEDAGAFFTEIFQADVPAGPVYLGVSTWIGSTSLTGQTISAYRIDGERLDTAAKVIKTRSGVTNSVGFGYDFFSVVDHRERPVRLFYFDDAKKSFRFPVVIEDKRTPQGRVTNKYITYRYDGKYFVKVS